MPRRALRHRDSHCLLSRAVRSSKQPSVRRACGTAVLAAVVLDRRLDRVLGQHRAVDLDRRQGQLLDDLGVLDPARLVEGLALHPLGDERRRGDRRAAAEGLELRVLDHALLVDLDLQLHDVAAGRRADHAGADALVALVERPDVARVLVVLDDFVLYAMSCLSSPPVQRALSARPTARCSDRCLPCTSPTAATSRAAAPPAATRVATA